MTNPTIRPFRLSDLSGLVDRDDPAPCPELLSLQAKAGPCFTFEDRGVILGCMGAILLFKGVSTVWMCLAPSVSGHGVWLTKTVKRMLADIIRAYQLHRVEAVVLCDSVRNRHWIEALGFTVEREGVARAFRSDQRDMVRYELVKG